MILVYKSRTCYQIPPSWTPFLWKKNTFRQTKLKQACCVVCVSSQPFYWITSSRQLPMSVYIKRLYSPSVIIPRGCWSGSKSSMRKSSPKSGSLVHSTVSDAGNLTEKSLYVVLYSIFFSSVFTIPRFTLSKTKHKWKINVSVRKNYSSSWH